MAVFSPEVERFSRAFANNHLQHAGGADGETLVQGTPNWHFFTRDGETAVRIMGEIANEAALRAVPKT
jgi:hypothetical protein